MFYDFDLFRRNAPPAALEDCALSELAEDRAKLWEAVGAASFLSDAEKRDMLGFAHAKVTE